MLEADVEGVSTFFSSLSSEAIWPRTGTNSVSWLNLKLSFILRSTEDDISRESKAYSRARLTMNGKGWNA